MKTGVCRICNKPKSKHAGQPAKPMMTGRIRGRSFGSRGRIRIKGLPWLGLENHLALAAKAWDAAKHPRDSHGHFIHTGQTIELNGQKLTVTGISKSGLTSVSDALTGMSAGDLNAAAVAKATVTSAPDMVHSTHHDARGFALKVGDKVDVVGTPGAAKKVGLATTGTHTVAHLDADGTVGVIHNETGIASNVGQGKLAAHAPVHHDSKGRVLHVGDTVHDKAGKSGQVTAILSNGEVAVDGKRRAATGLMFEHNKHIVVEQGTAEPELADWENQLLAPAPDAPKPELMEFQKVPANLSGAAWTAANQVVTAHNLAALKHNAAVNGVASHPDSNGEQLAVGDKVKKGGGKTTWNVTSLGIYPGANTPTITVSTIPGATAKGSAMHHPSDFTKIPEAAKPTLGQPLSAYTGQPTPGVEPLPSWVGEGVPIPAKDIIPGDNIIAPDIAGASLAGKQVSVTQSVTAAADSDQNYMTITDGVNTTTVLIPKATNVTLMPSTPAEPDPIGTDMEDEPIHVGDWVHIASSQEGDTSLAQIVTMDDGGLGIAEEGHAPYSLFDPSWLGGAKLASPPNPKLGVQTKASSLQPGDHVVIPGGGAPVHGVVSSVVTTKAGNILGFATPDGGGADIPFSSPPDNPVTHVGPVAAVDSTGAPIVKGDILNVGEAKWKVLSVGPDGVTAEYQDEYAAHPDALLTHDVLRSDGTHAGSMAKITVNATTKNLKVGDVVEPHVMGWVDKKTKQPITGPHTITYVGGSNVNVNGHVVNRTQLKFSDGTSVQLPTASKLTIHKAVAPPSPAAKAPDKPKVQLDATHARIQPGKHITVAGTAIDGDVVKVEHHDSGTSIAYQKADYTIGTAFIPGDKVALLSAGELATDGKPMPPPMPPAFPVPPGGKVDPLNPDGVMDVGGKEFPYNEVLASQLGEGQVVQIKGTSDTAVVTRVGPDTKPQTGTTTGQAVYGKINGVGEEQRLFAVTSNRKARILSKQPVIKAPPIPPVLPAPVTGTLGPSKPGVNNSTRLKAHKFVTAAGKDVHPKAKNQYDQAPQAKANIAAELATRLDTQEGWDTWRRHEIARGFADPGTFAMVSDSQRHTALSEASKDLIAKWAGTSGDSDRAALAMQLAIADQFGLDKSNTFEAAKSYGMSEFNSVKGLTQTEYEKRGEFMRLFAKEMHAHTQEEFAKAGITEISVYRGMNKTGDWGPPPPAEAVAQLQPANSWSTTTATAKKFGSNALFATFPVERVIGSARTGFGCLNEEEFVIMHGPGTVQVGYWT